MKINWSHLGEGLSGIADAKMSSDAAELLARQQQTTMQEQGGLQNNPNFTYDSDTGQYVPSLAQIQRDQGQGLDTSGAGYANRVYDSDTGTYPQSVLPQTDASATGLMPSFKAQSTFAGQTRDTPFTPDEVRSKNLQDTVDFWRSKGVFGKEMAKELQDAATSELHQKLLTGQIDQLGLEKQLKGQQVSEGDYRLDALKKAKETQDKLSDFMTRLYSTDPAVQKTALDEASALHNGNDAIGGTSKSTVIQDPNTKANSIIFHPPADQAGPPELHSANDPNVLNTIRGEYVKNMLYQTKPEEAMKLDEVARQHAATLGVERDKLGLQREEFGAKKPLYAAQAKEVSQRGDYYAQGGARGANSGVQQEKWEVQRRNGFITHLSNQIGFPDPISGKNIVSPTSDALVNALMDQGRSESFIRDNVSQLRAKYTTPEAFDAAAKEVLDNLRRGGGGAPASGEGSSASVKGTRDHPVIPPLSEAVEKPTVWDRNSMGFVPQQLAPKGRHWDRGLMTFVDD